MSAASQSSGTHTKGALAQIGVAGLEASPGAEEGDVYSIRLERNSQSDKPVVMWLCRAFPAAWGDRAHALKFHTKGEARRAAAGMKLAGAWSIEQD